MSSKDGWDGRRRMGFGDADAALLASIRHDLEHAERLIARGQALRARALARGEHLARLQASGSRQNVRDHDMAQRAVASELGARVRVSDRTIQRRMTASAELVDDYPATLDALRAGRIHEGHVRLITEIGTPLPLEARPGFDLAAMSLCMDKTPARARAGVERLAQQLHPRTLTERHQDARLRRGVWVREVGDGMSELCTVQPTVIADAIHDRLTRQARILQDARTTAREQSRAAERAGAAVDEQVRVLASDERTMDQTRADLLADMLLTATPESSIILGDDGPGTLGAIRAHVQVVVPALTLLDSDADIPDDGSSLVGRSRIDTDTARRLAGGSTTGWERVLTHPVSGQVLATDRYQIPPALRRRIHARDQHCRFPGCRVPAIRCEIDHTHDHALGGPTHHTNLAALCQRHHSMKQFTAWHVRQTTHGTLEWRSPLGATYTDTPEPPGPRFIPGS